MKLALVLFSFVFCNPVTGIEYYTATYDNIDVDAILNNERLFTQYMGCLLENGPCTADGRTLRRILPEAITTRCEKCNPRQKQIAKKISNHLKEKKPDIWIMLIEKIDPQEEDIAAFEEFLAQKEEEYLLR
ncbi:ejaculatory bulb-specific protein 3 [Harpegnathos saltator]|uniref:Ejaculatory bulb-specific protein 3 n=1 Tax=Harpegnathos saltator TaxID=610380 RepID=E2BG65_HARSA|nr:ejaculatory bulb-specific protein 3 [Harpegnathos saltator]EFN85333.1 Ejaculatory bulb-specific protein 3 [Harpegnathos saltator]